MKIKNVIPALITSSALLTVAPNVVATMSYQVSGMICDAVKGSGVTEKSQGLESGRTANEVSVACPVIKFGKTDEFRVQVNLLNNSNFIEDVDCQLRERKGGKQVRSSSGSVRLRANSYSEDMFWEGTLGADTHANIICSLPTGTAIESLTYSVEQASGGSSGDTGSNSGASSDSVAARACVTTPEINFGTTDKEVEFRNGMIINNYNGKYWRGGDETIVFRTRSNNWYVITEHGSPDSDVFELDVVKRPKSCMEPPTATPERVRTNASGDKVLVFRDGEITVKSSCALTTKSKLVAYNSNYEHTYVIDVKTANSCRVKELKEF